MVWFLAVKDGKIVESCMAKRSLMMYKNIAHIPPSHPSTKLSVFPTTNVQSSHTAIAAGAEQ